MTDNCAICNKSLSILESTVNKCKCEKVFCKKHKDPTRHHCDHDFFYENSNVLKNKLTQLPSQKVIVF